MSFDTSRMLEQPSLTDSGAAPKPTDSLFFAIFPDEPAARRIAQLALHLRGEHGLKGNPPAMERFHVTLHHLGSYAGLPPGVVARASDAAATGTTPPFDVAFDRAGSMSGRRGKRPFVLRGGDGVAALRAFQQSLGTAIQQVGLVGRARSHYTPHVTLLYDGRYVAEQAVETVGWAVHELVLVHSLLGRSQYVPLARWPLMP